MNTFKKAKIFLTSFAIGGLIGGVSGLLYAPKSGVETRAMIRDKSMELKDRVVENVEDTRLQAEQKLESLTQQARDKATKLRSIAEKTAAEEKEVMDKGVQDAKKVVNEGKWE